MSRAPLGRDVESKEAFGTEEVKEKERLGESVVRSLFWVLRRGEVREAAREEVERREDEVEHRLEGWSKELEEGCAAELMSEEQGWGIISED